MRIFIFITLLLAAGTRSFGDSDGYGCYGDGVLAFDQAFKDQTGLYLISWGTPVGISKTFRVELPRPHGSYSQGIQCDRDRLLILMRGVPPVSNTKELTKFTMHVTEVTLADRRNPHIVSDKPNHYQEWRRNVDRSIRPLGDGTPVISLPEPNLVLNNCGQRVIALWSPDPNRTYHLVFDSSKTTSTVKNGYGSIFHRCETSLLMKDRSGRVLARVIVANTVSEETID